MNDQTIRSTLSSAIGTLDLIQAQLSRAERGSDRDLIQRSREHLKRTSSDLLHLRARLNGEKPVDSTPHELLRPTF